MYGWSHTLAFITAHDVKGSIEQRGLVETYQEYIQDQELCNVLAMILDGND
jgi:hypothetical protein